MLHKYACGFVERSGIDNLQSKVDIGTSRPKPYPIELLLTSVNLHGRHCNVGSCCATISVPRLWRDERKWSTLSSYLLVGKRSEHHISLGVQHRAFLSNQDFVTTVALAPGPCRRTCPCRATWH
jgi:hypothetical protein